MSRPTLTMQVKRHDLLPPVTIAATYLDGTPVDLSAASSVRFYMRLTVAGDLSTPKINAPATIVDGANGVIRYSWTGTDTDSLGQYLAEFEVVLGGRPLSLPLTQMLLIEIIPDLA